MNQSTLSLGERICLVARLAVEEHLLQSVAQMESGRRVMVGGADLANCKPGSVMEDAPPSARLAEGEVE